MASAMSTSVPGVTSSGLELLRHPIRTAIAVLVGDVDTPVVTVLQEQEFGTGNLVDEPLRVLPRNQTIELAGDDLQRARDGLSASLEVQRQALGACVPFRGRLRSERERVARQLRQLVPEGAEVVRPCERDARADIAQAARHARGVVAAEADAPETDSIPLDSGPPCDVVDDRGARHLSVASDREVVLRLSLPGAINGERRQSPLEEELLGRAQLLLSRVQTGDQDDDR